MDEKQKNKLGDVLCDVGKYMLTVVPFGYFFSEQRYAVLIIIAVAVSGACLVFLGLKLVKKTDESVTVNNASSKKKVKLLKNTTYVIEEQQIQ